MPAINPTQPTGADDGRDGDLRQAIDSVIKRSFEKGVDSHDLPDHSYLAMKDISRHFFTEELLKLITAATDARVLENTQHIQQIILKERSGYINAHNLDGASAMFELHQKLNTLSPKGQND